MYAVKMFLKFIIKVFLLLRFDKNISLARNANLLFKNYLELLPMLFASNRIDSVREVFTEQYYLEHT
jgi:hypothetical protein